MGSHVQTHLRTTDRSIMAAPEMGVKVLTTICGVQQLQILTRIESGATVPVVCKTVVDYLIQTTMLTLLSLVGICQCDPGYSGNACENTTQTLPQVLNELFEDELSTSKWRWVAGGSSDTTCGTVVSGNAMVFK